MSGRLIMGSGVVGNFAAAYFRRYFPTLRVTVVGRSDQELPIVGESLVELSTHFLQDLGLSRTLIEQHLPKYGLTYYYTDSVGARLAARFGGPRGMIRQLRRFDPLIARAARKLSPPSPEHFIKVQSSSTLNFPYFEYHRDEDIPRSIFQMFRHMTAMRLRLLRLAGIRSWFDPVQLGALAQTLISAAAVACFGRRSLKNSRLIQWMVAPRPQARTRGATVAAAAGHVKPWIRRIAERLPVSRRLRLP